MPELAVPTPPIDMAESRPPLPPFTLETAKAKVQAAEAAWNSRNPDQVALAYTVNSKWHNRAEFIQENWEFAPNGLMQRREASINDVSIQKSERKFRWAR